MELKLMVDHDKYTFWMQTKPVIDEINDNSCREKPPYSILVSEFEISIPL